MPNHAAPHTNLADQPVAMMEAVFDRHNAGVCPFGPLTEAEVAHEAAYLRYEEESEREEEARVAAGGRTVCPSCGHRSVTHRSVATLGGGLPGSEYSDFAKCGRCDYEAL